MEETAAQNYLPMVAQLLTGQFKASDWQVELGVEPTGAFYAYTPHAAALRVMPYANLNEIPANSVAVHTISGVMMEEDSCFSLGTRSIGRAIQQADAHENIVAHVGRFNTPGGSTSGLENFAGIIAGTQKPFVGYAQMACSAGYWSISGADRVVASGRTAMIGSIGTMISLADFSEYYAKMGIKTHDIRATASTNKNEAFYQAQQGKYDAIRQQLLDPLNEAFMSTVRANREGKLNAKQEKEILSGLVYIGQATIDMGLADELGTFDDAVRIALELAEEADDTPIDSPSTSNTMFGKNKFSAVAALAGLQGTAVTAALVSAANDELEEKEITGAALIAKADFDALTAKADRVDAAEAAAKGYTDALAAAGVKDIAELVAQRDEAREQAKEFGEQPGELPTTASKEGSDITDEGGDDKGWEAIHNRMLGEI
ncbi:S49 family peptidase [Hymenobacter sp. BT523]|uniref:S49 family peptidase n=1 Tax=Hymenobacter sp. BT523 TaxID=2795725 RepID=UPI0018ED87A7|nr:S49 family peptidase [Hymenobacter sp. BT523]MBJ6109450.1 S49 family peptidase [Hymenobacter sp. BT523]